VARQRRQVIYIHPEQHRGNNSALDDTNRIPRHVDVAE
jgi:hypothetical protein